MTLEWIALMALLALVAAALGTSLYLFASLKRECAEHRRDTSESTSAFAAALREMETRIAQLERELEGVPAAPAAASGINLNRRTQALRLIRKGEAPDHVAAVLSLPLKEVQLLSKVNRIATTSSPGGLA